MIWIPHRLIGFGALLFLLIAAAGCSSTAPPSAETPSIHWEKYSDDVFARAKRENKFVLMDLEAVWCHWCHVQDEITYRDSKVIALIGSRYIPVKVDQDSRPDLSNRYEDYGWPATIVFNGDGGEIVKRAGYIPPKPMSAMLQAIIDDPTPGPSVGRETKIEFGDRAALSADLRADLISRLDEGYDAKLGGWGDIHKFLDWDAIEWCLVRARAGDAQAEHRARQTLDAAIKLIDPVWGGVYQYSTDGDWDHPHFEKLMQYQANVLRAYSLAYAQFNEPRYRKAADSIRRYLVDFLTSPEGAFYVSQDADVVQGQHSAGYFALDDAARRKIGIPRVDTHRYARENGWAIAGVVAYFERTQDPADLAAARRAAEWVIANRSLPAGGFRHDSADAAGPYLGDTLAMGQAFLALYEATGERPWLARAQQSAYYINSHFRPPRGSAGFVTAVASPSDPLPPRPQIDENIGMARFCNMLYYYVGSQADRMMADEAMRYLAAPQIAHSRHLFFAGILLADAEFSAEPLHVTIVGKKQDPAARTLFNEAMKSPVAYRRLEWFDPAEGKLPNADVEYPMLSAASAFICTGTTCSSPISDVARLDKKLNISGPVSPRAHD